MGASQLFTNGGHPEGMAAGRREDSWWIGPMATVVVLGGASILPIIAGSSV